jgi:sulfate adenylyltransferase large subunit
MAIEGSIVAAATGSEAAEGSTAGVGSAAAGLLRFSTAGSVDDGKSTLIGRLLHDSRGIFEDQLAALELASRRRGRPEVDLALLTDGLRAEREQGITIDVAHRYFATPRRRFVIADTPGHVQYTRNMVTGASNADLAVVLVDARQGVVEQTRRHLLIAALLGVPHVVGAVNKMDLVGWEAGRFAEIRADLEALASRLGVRPPVSIPISALRGDNVVERSPAMAWYDGPTFLDHLETVEVSAAHDLARIRFPVQWVIRATTAADPDYRALAGRVAGGILRPGEPVLAFPGGIPTTIAAIETHDGPRAEARPPDSVAIRLADDVDLGRGGLLTGPDDAPAPRRDLEALVCWLGDAPLIPGRRYWLQHTTRSVRAVATTVQARMDVPTFAWQPGPPSLGPNEIGRVRLALSEPIFADAYRDNRTTGSAILIDEATNGTVGAVLVVGPEPWP